MRQAKNGPERRLNHEHVERFSCATLKQYGRRSRERIKEKKQIESGYEIVGFGGKWRAMLKVRSFEILSLLFAKGGCLVRNSVEVR